MACQRKSACGVNQNRRRLNALARRNCHFEEILRNLDLHLAASRNSIPLASIFARLQTMDFDLEELVNVEQTCVPASG